MSNFFGASLWPGLILWMILYISDYYLTVACARLYQAQVGQKITFEGSFELTPYFQKDIDSLRMFSPHFWAMTVLGAALLGITWFFTAGDTPELYELILGSAILIQLAIHVRHFQNLFLYRAIKTDAVRGHIEYSRPFTLRTSAVQLYAFAGLFAVMCVVLRSWFVLGGMFACAFTAAQHQNAARKWAAKAQAKAATSAD